MKDENILVIGGAGYLGSVLCRKLLNKGYKVRALDNLLYTDVGIKDLYPNDNFNLYKGDIKDIQDILFATKHIDKVIHLAAIVGDPASNLNPEETTEVNYFSTKMIAGICKNKNIRKFVFASTASVYGKSETEGILTERSKLNPLTLYAKMKLKSENALLELKDKNFSPTILRMGTLYGVSPRMRFDLVVNHFTINALKNKSISLHGGNQNRPFCHINDAADAYIKCIEKDNVSGEIFNVSTENYKISDLGKIITNNIDGTTLTINKDKVDERSYLLSTDKIKKNIGFKGSYNIIKGIQEIKEKANQWNYKEPIYDNYEYLRRNTT